MKNTILIQIFLLLFTFTGIKANTNLFKNIDPHNKEYFSTFRKDEQPENKKFILLNKTSEEKGIAYYVVYKENSQGQGFYFKVVMDKNEKPVATYYANENKEGISASTLQNLKNILSPPETLTSEFAETPAQCVTKCHRTNGCYDKLTNTGVLLCSLDCQVSCA